MMMMLMVVMMMTVAVVHGRDCVPCCVERACVRDINVCDDGLVCQGMSSHLVAAELLLN